MPAICTVQPTKKFKILFFILLFSPIWNSLFAATITSAATGNWNAGGTWVGGVVPATTDNVIIANGHTVTVNVASTIVDVTINNGGAITVGGVAFTVNGTTTVGGGTSGSLSITSNTAIKTFTGLVTINSGATFTSTSVITTGNQIFKGGITNNGGNNTTSFAGGAATFNTNAQALNGNTTVNFNGVVTVTGVTLTNNITVSMTSTAAPALTGVGGTWLQANGSTLNFSGSTMTNLTLNASTNSNTVNYNRNNTQTIYGATYYDLTTSGGAGTKTLGGATIVNNAVNVGTGTTFALSTFDFQVNGTTDITGTMTDASATGTNLFVGLVTVDGTRTHAGNPAVTYRGGITNNGTFTAGTGIHTFDTNDQALTGTFTIPSVTVTGVTLTNNNTLNVTTALAGTGGLTQAASSTLNINFPGAVGITTLTASANGNTVDYCDGAAQTVVQTTYHHLSINASAGAGIKTLSGATTVNGNLTIGANTLADGGFVLTVKGNMDITGTSAHTGAGSITLSGGSAAHDLSGGGTCQNLIMNDAQGATLSGAIIVAGTLTLTSGKITLNAFNLTLNSITGLSGGTSSNYIITNSSGVLRRAINAAAGGTYNFPLGSAASYNPATVVWAADPGTVTFLNGSYTATTVSNGTGLPTSVGTLSINNLLNNGYWTFLQTGTISTNFDITLTRNGHTNAGANLNIHGIVKRTSSATSWAAAGTWTQPASSARTATAEISIAQTDINSFGEFDIGDGCIIEPILGGNVGACVGSTTAAFTDATPGGTWSITNGTGSATIDAGGVVTGVTTGTVTILYTVGGCIAGKEISVYKGGTATPTTTMICSGSTTTISVSGNVGLRQWQDNVNGSGWVTGTGTNGTGTPYTTPAMTYPNTYQFRLLTGPTSATALCPSSVTTTITPQEAATADPGVPTNYGFLDPALSLTTKGKALCPDTYTFTQRILNSRSTIAVGATVTVANLIAGTDATTMTSGTFNGTAIAMGTTTTTATTVTFLAPVAVTYACPSAAFTIVLNGITNPGYNLTGNATVTAVNSTGGLDNGTYPYQTAYHIGDYYDFDQATATNYTTQNGLDHCYNNLAAGTYCFEYTNPTSGPVKIGTIQEAGTSGCSVSNSGFASVGDATSGCATAGAAGTSQYLYFPDCSSVAGAGKAGSCVTAGAVYTTCVTVPVGCDGQNFCPLIDCSGTCGGGPLPIELLYFEAKLNGGIVELNWATATETNNDFFTLEKTIDGNVYFDFLKVDGAGNSTSVLQYNTVDERPFEGLSYYRLMQTDYDGKFAYSKLVPINMDPFAKLAIKYVRANQDNNNLQYQLSSANDNPISVTVIDVLGKIILTERIGFAPDGQTLYMNAAGLGKGVYFLKVSDGINMAVKKFIY